ncbi:hypothetical protein JMJ35_001379 [Cladonia borealis]|uniref:Uncharacterized protein n=1 Tax=Cladonia borealis TaxID=184061 RepID=A0AA39UEQ0_9LECA|nr:hypothetical protein JMJ35_001379 [Cladonia borealis]
MGSMLTPPETPPKPPSFIMSKRYSKALTTLCAAAFFFLLFRTVNRAFNHEPLLRVGPLHGASLWKKVLETGETRWKTISRRMSPDPALPPPMDNTDGEKIFHSGKYLAIYLGPPGQAVENRKGGGEAFQKFVQHLPRDTASEIPLTETYFDVGVRREPYDKNMEDYQMAVRNTGEPHGILIIRSLQRGRDPRLTASDCMFYAWREFATKLIGPGHPWRPINNLRYVIFDNIKVRETIEVIEMAYSKFNFGQKAISEPQIKVGEFRHWLYKPPREREMMLAILGTPNVASFARMLGDHFAEIGHKCIIGLASEQVEGQWMLGVLIGNEFGGECLDREVPDVVQGDRYIQEYKEEQARKEEEQAQKDQEKAEEKTRKKAEKAGSTDQKPMGDKESKNDEDESATEPAEENKRPKLEDFYKEEKKEDDEKEAAKEKKASKKKASKEEDEAKKEDPANEKDAATEKDAAKDPSKKDDVTKDASTDSDTLSEKPSSEGDKKNANEDEEAEEEEEKDPSKLPEETEAQRKAKLERAFKKQVDRRVDGSNKGAAVIAV